MTETLDVPGVSLGRRLAVGGMGELFLAERVAPDGTRHACVVKRLLPNAGEAERMMFAREARALTLVTEQHGEGVVRLLASSATTIVLEHVAGVDLGTLLEARMKRGRPLPIPAGLAVIGGLLRGLVTLNRLGIVHRDINPSNVLLGSDGRVVLADLGVAAFSDERGPTIAGLKGTLAYMAPEQLREGAADHASDVYAAGLVAYEALSGVLARPQGTAGLAELLAARERVPMPPSAVRPDAAPFDALVLAALAPEPAARPRLVEWSDQWTHLGGADAAMLASAVQALVPSPPPASAPASVPAPASAKRWPWLAGASAIGIGGAVAIGIAGAGERTGSTRGEGRALATLARVERVVVASAPDVVEVVDVVEPTDTIEVVEATEVIARPDVVDVVSKPEPLTRSVIVKSGDGRPVHVTGAGRRGLAGSASGWVLAEGEGALIDVVGGEPAFFARLRILVREGRVLLNVGPAKDGPRLQAVCGSHSGPRLSGVPIGPGGSVTCRLEAAGGASMSFVVVDEPR